MDLFMKNIQLTKPQSSQKRRSIQQLTRPVTRAEKLGMTPDQEEKLRVKTLWRQLIRWQGFDDYMFLRDYEQLKVTKGVDLMNAQDLFEPINFTQGVSVAKLGGLFGSNDQQQEYFDQQRKVHLLKVKQNYEPGNINSQKFNSQIYQKEFNEEVKSPSIQRRRNSGAVNLRIAQFISDVQTDIEVISRFVSVQEIETLSPILQQMIKTLWRIGIYNFYIIGSFIYCLILQVKYTSKISFKLYGRQKVAYQNWKRYIRLCNMQGTKTHKYKLVGYKHIAKILINQQQFNKALVYLKKMLKLSWTIGDSNFELLAYDLISLVYYYQQEIKKAQFYHEKFANGDVELKSSGIRNVGEQNYLLQSKLKDNMADQNSFSEDDFDLDVLMQNATLNKWETQNKRSEMQLKLQSTVQPMVYTKGHSFSKIKRIEEKPFNTQISRKLINDFKDKSSIPLGPIYQKLTDFSSQKLIILMNILQSYLKPVDKNFSSVRYLYNQKSLNRGLSNFLQNCENINDKDNLKVQKDMQAFKPIETILYIQKMLKVFQYDLKFYGQYQTLFSGDLDHFL